jgi:hypothetical protein
VSDQGVYVCEFYENLEAMIREFDQKMPACDWGQTLGSSSCAIADELVDLILGMKGYKQYTHRSEWTARLKERLAESEQ